MKNKVLYLLTAAAIIVLVVLFYFLKPKTTTVSEQINQNPLPRQASQSAPEPKTFELAVKAGKLVSGPESLNVIEGDNVVIKITCDKEEELHLHGYDKSVDLQKDITAELSFTASLTGRFILELENSKAEIGALEVLPK